MIRRRGAGLRTVLISAVLALVAGLFVGVASPAQAVETITTAPSTIDPTATVAVTIHGFPAMASGNGYIYFLDFVNLTGNAANTGASTGSPGSQTNCAGGVTFAGTGAGTAAPNGQTVVGTTNACEWMSTTKFKFSYTGTAGLNGTSDVTVTFPANRFTLPASGEYGINFTAGATQQYALSYVCWGNCPVSSGAGAPPAPPTVTIDIDGNTGKCATSKVTGPMGTWANAPKATDCTKPGYVFKSFNTRVDGKGLEILANGNLNLTGDNRLFAQWVDPTAPVLAPGAPRNVVATGKWQHITVNWDAPTDSGTYPITNYLVQASPGSAVCITRQTDKKFTQCSYAQLNPGSKYTFKVQALNGGGWGAQSVASNEAVSTDLRIKSFSRVKPFLYFGASKVTVGGTASGYPAGTKLTPWVQIGANGKWVAQKGSSAKVAADSNFSWETKISRGDNNATVSVKFTADGDNFSNAVSIKPVK